MNMSVIIGVIVLIIMIGGWSTIGVKQMRSEISRWTVSHFERLYDLAYETGQEVVENTRVKETFGDRILAVPYPSMKKFGPPWRVMSPKKYFKKFAQIEARIEDLMTELAKKYTESKLTDIEYEYTELSRLYSKMGFESRTLLHEDSEDNSGSHLTLVKG